MYQINIEASIKHFVSNFTQLKNFCSWVKLKNRFLIHSLESDGIILSDY
jgi:hypothetical protein